MALDMFDGFTLFLFVIVLGGEIMRLHLVLTHQSSEMHGRGVIHFGFDPR